MVAPLAVSGDVFFDALGALRAEYERVLAENTALRPGRLSRRNVNFRVEPAQLHEPLPEVGPGVRA